MKLLACFALFALGFATVAAAQDETGSSRVALAPNALVCDAEIVLEFLQWDTVASVEAAITNADCAASSGAFEIDARIRNENGELQTLSFSEAWHRDDDQPVSFNGEYPIGENVELIQMRASPVDCTCAGGTAVLASFANRREGTEEGSAQAVAVSATAHAAQRGASRQEGAGGASEAGQIESEVLVLGSRIECRKVTVVGSRMPKEVCVDIQQAALNGEQEEQAAQEMLRRMRERSTMPAQPASPFPGSGLPGF
jgi:hypothetical protein